MKFCHLNFHVGNFFRRYQAWVEFQQLHGSHRPAAVVSGMDCDAVRVYMPQEIEKVLADERPVVGIDLREGLKEASLLNKLPTHKHYIIFSGSHPSAPPNITVDHTLICYESILGDMFELHLNPRSPFFYTNRFYNFDQHKSLHFVHFSAVPRAHRVQMAQWLTQSTNKNFVFRLNGKDHGQPANDLDDIDFSTSGSDIAQWFEQSAMHTQHPHLHIVGRIPVNMLNQARFNLVLESDFEFAVHYTTEKVIRPLILGMPFVLGSSAGHLGRLHQMGFKTYSDLWDESYDQELDGDRRLRQVFETVRQLFEFDWDRHREHLQSIGAHNQAQFARLGPWFDKEFQLFEQAIANSPAASLIYAPK